MEVITEPISADGLIGYDRFGQLQLCKPMDGGSRCYTFTTDLRGKKCALCGGEWDFNAESWSDHWYWHRYEERVHESCFVNYLDHKNRDDAFGHLCDARLAFEIERVPNPYYPRGRWANLCAYRFELRDYPVSITIGVRKRVTEITATPREGELAWSKAAEEVFDTERVTKEFSPRRVLLHAWTREDERDYVCKLAELIKA
jgi:hypothetical protein